MGLRHYFQFGLFICATLALSGSSVFAQPPAKSSEEQPTSKKKFKEFSPDGKFKISMPGKPTDSSLEQNGLEIKIWVLEVENVGVYLVSSTALPTPKNLSEDEIAETLDKSATGQVGGMGGKETKRREIKLNKTHQGLQIEAELPKSKDSPNGGVAIGRLYLVDGHLYQILALGDKEFTTSKEVKRFLDSFQVGEK